MIHSIRANNPSFRTVSLEPGFNVILADITNKSAKKDSRNGLGKSSIVEIIHFCLGAKAARGKGLLVAALKGWIFYLDITLNNKNVVVSRSTDSPSKIFIRGDISEWPIRKKSSNLLDYNSFTLKEWNFILSHFMFGLGDTEIQDYEPTYRSLISYFIRRGRDAFNTPFEYFRKQPEWSKQVHNAYLLDLTWESASKLQSLKDRRKLVHHLKKASTNGLMSDFLGSIGDLEASKVELERSLARTDRNLADFRVHPQYREIEDEQIRLTRELHKATNANTRDLKSLEFYQSENEPETTASNDDIFRLYEEVGTVFPDAVKRRFEDVEAFHAQLVQDRKQFLLNEVLRLQIAISTREQQMRVMDERRASLLKILESHGALEEYLGLQQQRSETLNKSLQIQRLINNLRGFEEEISNIRIDHEMLIRQMRLEYSQRANQLAKALGYFGANSHELYTTAGKLIVDVSTNGYNFNVEIQRSNSEGISSMKVFCYDMTLIQLWTDPDKISSPRMLIHDSTLFDSVDSRQVALALELAANESEKKNFQYLCLLNSDSLPNFEFSEEFRILDFVRLRLTDATPEGGLFGFRYS